MSRHRLEIESDSAEVTSFNREEPNTGNASLPTVTSQASMQMTHRSSSLSTHLIFSPV